MPLFVLIFILVVLTLLLQLGLFGIVLTKLGLSADSAMLLFSSTLLGSLVNLPLFKLKHPVKEPPENYQPPLLVFAPRFLPTDKTIIAINVGGALIPVCFSIYLISLHQLAAWQLLVAISIVTMVSYLFSRPIKGLGIGMPILIAPFTAAVTALVMAPEHSPPLAYICGTLGVLTGADIFRIKDIKSFNVPIASIGGAGTFDGIFFTGIIAVLLA